MATGKLEAIGYIFIWTPSYLTISIKIAYFPLGSPENFLKKSFRKPPSWKLESRDTDVCRYASVMIRFVQSLTAQVTGINDPPDETSEPARKKAKQDQDEEFEFADQLVGDPDGIDQPDEPGSGSASSSAQQAMIAQAAGVQEVEFSDCPLCGTPHFSVHVVCPTCLLKSYS